MLSQGMHMTCEALGCDHNDTKLCHLCGASLCIEHLGLSKSCGLTCKVPKAEVIFEPGSWSKSTDGPIRTALGSLLGWTGPALLFVVGGLVWWLLLPAFVRLLNWLGSDESGGLLFPLNMIVWGLALGFFVIPILFILPIYTALVDSTKLKKPQASPVSSPRPVPSPAHKLFSHPKAWDEIPDVSHLTYEEYLSSVEWRDRRSILLDRFSHKCQICGSSAKLQIHHRTYERVGNERIEDLTVLCDACHGLYHAHRGIPQAH